MNKCPECGCENITSRHNFKNEETTYRCNGCKKNFYRDENERDKYIYKHIKKDIDEGKKLFLAFTKAKRGR